MILYIDFQDSKNEKKAIKALINAIKVGLAESQNYPNYSRSVCNENPALMFETAVHGQINKTPPSEFFFRNGDLLKSYIQRNKG